MFALLFGPIIYRVTNIIMMWHFILFRVFVGLELHSKLVDSLKNNYDALVEDDDRQ